VIVLKLGGSLLSSSSLRKWLQLSVKQGKGKLVIVPGGGVFADQVRSTQKQWHYDEKTAHYMAILAMQQMALLLNGLTEGLSIINKVNQIPTALANQQVVLWSPLASELDAGKIKPSWDVTSDTLSAWLAKQLSARNLLLVKSVQVMSGISLDELSEQGIVDKAFASFMHENPSLSFDCIPSSSSAYFSQYLEQHA